MVLFLQSWQSSLLSTTNGICLPLRVSTRWVSGVKLWSLIINSTDQKSNSVWSCHWFSLTSLVAFSEVNGQVWDGLSDWLDSHWFIEVESVILSFNSCMVNQNASITHNSTHGACAVSIKFNQLLTLWIGHDELAWLKLLLDSQDYSSICLDSNRSWSKLHHNRYRLASHLIPPSPFLCSLLTKKAKTPLLTLIAFIAYSIWKIRPSGEKVLTPLSYWPPL